jgi:hypothetical protein
MTGSGPVHEPVLAAMLLAMAMGPLARRPVLMLGFPSSIEKLGSVAVQVQVHRTVVFPTHPAPVGLVICKVAETRAGTRAARAARRVNIVFSLGLENKRE